MFVNQADTLLDIATALLAVGGPYNANKAALYTNDLIPSRTSGLADFVITDFGGLTNLKTVAWGVPFLNANQQAEVLGGLLNWLTLTAVGLPITVYGYVVTDTAGAVLVLAERFPQPIVFNRAGQNQGLVPRLLIDT